MSKVPFHVLAIQVDLLYSKEFPEGDDQAIEEHCQYIAEFIRSCGYTEEEYFERWMRGNDDETN